MRMGGALTAGILIAIGIAIFRRPAAAAAAPAGGMPEPAPGESSEAYMSRVESWGLQSGQVYPTMMEGGFGRTGPMWRSAAMVQRRR